MVAIWSHFVSLYFVGELLSMCFVMPGAPFTNMD